MGLGTTAQGVVRGRGAPRRPANAIVCPKCGALNPIAEARCRTCHCLLRSQAPKHAPRAVAPIVNPSQEEMDAALGELEDLLREDEVPPDRSGCPWCGHTLDEDDLPAPRITIALNPESVVGFECPRCGAPVSEDATDCSCGVRFSS